MRPNEIAKEIAKYLKKESGTERWLLTEPHLLHLGEAQSRQYVQMLTHQHYSSDFHSDVLTLIQNSIKEIVGTGSELTLVDLGPAFPEKSIPIVSNCKRYGAKVRYMPVDVNEDFLSKATAELKELAIDVEPLRGNFVDPSFHLPVSSKDSSKILLTMGLAFMNYSPDEVLPVMKRLAGEGGRVLLAAEIITAANNIGAIMERYSGPEAQQLAFAPLRGIGLLPEDVEGRLSFTNDRVEAVFTLKIDFQASRSVKLLKGTEIVTGVSYRFKREALKQHFENHFARVSLYGTPEMSTVVALLNT